MGVAVISKRELPLYLNGSCRYIKMGVAVISNPEFQLNVPESQTTIQPDGTDYTVAAQTGHTLMPVRQHSERDLLNTVMIVTL